MRAPLLVALGLAAAALGVWAVSLVGEPARPAARPTTAAAAPSAPAAAPAPPPPAPANLADVPQLVLAPRLDPATAREAGVARPEAEASFEAVMRTLEGLADRGERLPRARRDELYRNVNDAFAGLSATLDPNSAEDMQILEDANIRMKAMLSELRIGVPRRLPAAP